MTRNRNNIATPLFSIGIQSLVLGFCIIASADAASVVSRNQRPSTAASRVPTMTARIQSESKAPKTTTATTEPESETPDSEPVISEEIDTEIITETETAEPIENKSSTFDEILNVTNDNDSYSESLAEQIRAQRAALDAADAILTAEQKSQRAKSGNANTCDANLRACMQSKCGQDYSKCAGDTDTMWGTKMDACRRDLPCTGNEYRLFASEIKADRDANAQISSYNAIIDCGNRYNDCIISECGKTFTKCLGKSAGDAAISKCQKIAHSCIEMDNGLASRVMNVFGTLRQEAEKQVAADEKRLYELRDLMASTCKRLGAMFDERTLDCVYTVNFYAGDKNTLYASKKAYAGSSFNCDQNWFGIDITTFRENAYRLTREQKSASSAFLGAGLGTAVGAVTSGAIDRAVDRARADKALNDAKDEHDEIYGDDDTSGDKKQGTGDTSQESDKKQDTGDTTKTESANTSSGKPDANTSSGKTADNTTSTETESDKAEKE